MNDFKPRFLKPSDTSNYLVDKNDSTNLVEFTNFVYNKNLSQSIQTQRQRLPIFQNRNHILYLLEKYQTLVLVGETGCGKSTQIPQPYNNKMIGPSSQVSKILLVLLLLMYIFFIWMDCNLFLRIQNYPRERNMDDNVTSNYEAVSWLGCKISPLCDVTVKALLLDHTNHYLFAPLVTIVDTVFKISQVSWITPNAISIFHIFVAILSAKCISSDSLPYRRLGAFLFEIRTFLDDMDGHVARARRHIKGERSEIGTSGYYIDGLCDAAGCVALMIGTFVFLKNNPPRRGYIQLPTVSTNDCKDHETSVVYKAKVTTKKVARIICCFSLQLLISSTAWNRYIALYQDILERNDVSILEGMRQDVIFKSSFFFSVAWLWRIVNVHNMIHCLLLAIFCDKLWDFLRYMQYLGFTILFIAICITEFHLLDMQNYIFRTLTGNGTNY